MKTDRIKDMLANAVAIDLETHLIQPGLLSPPVVCGSASEAAERDKGQLLSKEQARYVFDLLLNTPTATIVGANIAYDMLCIAVDFAARGIDIMPAIFAAYDPSQKIISGDCDGRVFDVQRAEELHAIANGHLGKDALSGRPLADPITGKQAKYSLAVVTQQVLGRIDAKANDRFRLRYAELENVPMEEWPFEAKQYPIDDAVNTLECGLAQAGHLPSVNAHQWEPSLGEPDVLVCSPCGAALTRDAPQECLVRRPRRNLHDLSRQCYAAWALHLGDAWGFKVNQAAVTALEHKYGDLRPKEAEPFIKAGIIRADGSENQSILKKLVAEAYGAKYTCPTCRGECRVPSPATGGKSKINCAACGGTGYDLPPEVPRTDKGGIGTGRDVMQESGDEFLMAKGDYDEGEKILSTYIPLMRRGRVCLECNQPGTKKNKHLESCSFWANYEREPGWREVPLNLRSNTLVETGRCSYYDGIHGLPRKGGVRECFEARPGWILSSTDYSSGEMVMHAQNCIWMVGYSKLAEALNAGLDPHLALAGTMLGKGYDEMVKLKKAKDLVADLNRQAAKNANFGFMGGMAELTFVLRKRSEPGLFTPCVNGPDEQKGVRGYKGFRPCIVMDGADRCGVQKMTFYKKASCSPVCVRCVESAKRLREYWLRQWPENNMRDGYFAKISNIVDTGGGEVVQHKTRRIRGGVGFCDGANGYFQGMLADAMKNAYCQISRECYDKTVRVENSEFMTSKFAGGPSPLYGSRAILLAHDETFAEHPELVAHEAATRIGELMVTAERNMCPDMVPACKADPALMLKLYKGAESVFGADGRLIPWEPPA